MSVLGDVYEYCTNNDVQLIIYPIRVAPAATIRDCCNINDYFIFLDAGSLHSLQQMSSVAAHEIGHVATGALHKVTSPLELVGKNEYKAQRWTTERFVPYEKLKESLRQGAQVWELAEMFELTESDIQWAYDYYKERRGLVFDD